MGEVKEETQKAGMPYDELAALAKQLYEENAALRDERGIVRMNFLFKIVEHGRSFHPEVVTKAVQEISEVMFPERKEGNE